MNPYGCFFSWTNLIDRPGVAIRADSEDGGCTAQYLATPSMEELWRAAGPTGAITVTLDADLAVDLVALACWRRGLVLPADGLVRLQLDGTAPIDTGWQPSGVDADAGVWVCRLPAPTTMRTLRLGLDAGAAPYVQVSRLWLGLAAEPDWGFAPGAGFTWVDTGSSTRTPSGRIDDEAGVRYRRLRVSFDAASDRDAAMFQAGTLRAGKTRQFLFCREGSDASRQTILCHAADVPETVSSDVDANALSFDLSEDT